MDNNNLFSIGEVAKAARITRKTILNYESKGLIKPDKKEGITGNRYYTIDTFTQIRTIRVFQNLGLSLDEIRKYLNGSSDLDPMIERLRKMRDELNITIQKLSERANKHCDTIKEITIDAQTVYCRTYESDSVENKSNALRNTALEAMKIYGTDTTRYMYFTEISVNAPESVSYCIAVPRQSEGEYIKLLPELKAISLFHHGAYKDIPNVRKQLIEYAKKHEIKLTGKFRNLYIEGPPQHKDEKKFITQIIAIIE